MQWRDDALILGARRFGEHGLILDVLTASRGRRSGLVHGGASRKRRGQFEAGNTLHVSWTGRLEEQLGRFDVAEVAVARSARHLEDATALSAVTAVTALLRNALDEGDEAGSALYVPSTLLLDALETQDVWPALYARWELGLLSALGFGLDLDSCALSGANDGLTHVSPNTGRAVRGSEAQDYVDRLLVLPRFLIDSRAPSTPDDIAAALRLTGHFLEKRLFAAVHRAVPPERARLMSRVLKDAQIS